MKKPIALGFLILAFIMASMAQDKPRAEVFGGYSYLRTSEGGLDLNFNGGSVSVSVNPNDWLGVVADFGGYHASPDVSSFIVGLPLSADVGVNTFSYLFGPKVAMRSNEKVTPFFHALFGGARQTVNVNVAGIGVSDTENAFAMALGGGLDVKASNSIAIRVVQAEYVRTQFTDGADNRQNSIRLSGGIVFRFGER